jgi:DNA-binding transcriptional LysR family regulator
MSRSTGTSLGLIVAFAAAARQGSFAGAARDLGISPSAVSKNVARLEARMKVRLFHRTTRQISMSPDGEELYERCQRILAEVEALDASAADARTGLRGTLRIDLPITYGRLVVVPVLARLSARHPGLAIDARFSDQVVDLVKEGLDAAVRIGRWPTHAWSRACSISRYCTPAPVRPTCVATVHRSLPTNSRRIRA